MHILAEVHAEAGAEVDSTFQDTRADTLDVREIAFLQTPQDFINTSESYLIQLAEPRGERLVSLAIDVTTHLNHF